MATQRNASNPAFSPRGWALLALGAAQALIAAPAAAQAVVPIGDTRHGAHVVLLGTAAGRTAWRGTELAGISSALVVQGNVYLVDFGQGWERRFYQAGLAAKGRGMAGLESIRAAFVTHMHADHVVDFPVLMLFGASDGLASRAQPLSVFGPGPRGSQVPVVGRPEDQVPVVAPDAPTPGMVGMVQGLARAFATDINDNIRDSQKPDPLSKLRVTEIRVPEGVVTDPNRDPAPRMEPFAVYQDEHVKVSAILVDHAPVYPAFAYRFDTAAGSVTFSGDTNAHPNLIRLATGSDVLVQEVIDPDWVAERFPKPMTPDQAAKARHLIEAHTDVNDVGPLARAARVKSVVLSHLGPADPSPERWARARKGYDGPVTVGRDLMWIGVGQARP